MAAPGASSPDELPIDVELIKVLASDSRRDILRMLGERRKTLTELAEAMGLKKATVLEHLQKLVAAGLIKKLDEDERLWIYYELSPRGKRLVRPERTRFYLILGGTAAAALLLGIVVAASVLLSNPLTERDAGANAELADESAKMFEGEDSAAPQTAWRGLDERVDIRIAEAPDDATLILRSSDGTTHALDIAGSVATLDASALDGIAPGDYALSLAGAAGEAPLPQTFRVRDPAVAIFPRVLTVGENATIELALAAAGYPAPANATVLLGDVEHRLVGQSVAFLSIEPAGPMEVKVGRFFAGEIQALPAFEATMRNDNGSLRIAITERGAPLADAQIIIDGSAMGITDADGSLLAPWPAPGQRALRIAAPDGRARELPIEIGVVEVAEIAPQIRIEALDARLPGIEGMRVRAEIFNDGPAEAIVTIAAREGNALLASEIARVPAHGRTEVLLASHLAAPHLIDVTAHSAHPVFQRLQIDDASSSNATSSAPVAGAAPPMAPSYTEADGDGAASAGESDALEYRASSTSANVVARDTLVLPQLAGTPAEERAEAAGRAAQTPSGGALVALLAAVLVALALRARRR